MKVEVNRKYYIRRALTVVLFSIGMTACGDSFESSIPNVSFYFSCDLVQAEYARITIPGQFIKKTKNVNGIKIGYAGLIIGQSVFSEGNTYVAYDAACPVEASRDVAVNVEEDGMGTAVCPKCHTKYNLSQNGFPEGEGKEYLKHYNVMVSGTLLTVSN